MGSKYFTFGYFIANFNGMVFSTDSIKCKISRRQGLVDVLGDEDEVTDSCDLYHTLNELLTLLSNAGQRFFHLHKSLKNTLVDEHYKEIPNPFNGGDDDYIILDFLNKEFTWGENGFAPFCYLDDLNTNYIKHNLKELISIRTFY